MPTVILKQGETLSVELYETDGRFEITYGCYETNPHITVYADLPDSSGREGIIYNEDFGESPDEKYKELAEEVNKTENKLRNPSNYCTVREKQDGGDNLIICGHLSPCPIHDPIPMRKI